jgi:hypothetical protein
MDLGVLRQKAEKLIPPPKEPVGSVGGIGLLGVETQQAARSVKDSDFGGILHGPTDQPIAPVENVCFHGYQATLSRR